MHVTYLPTLAYTHQHTGWSQHIKSEGKKGGREHLLWFRQSYLTFEMDANYRNRPSSVKFDNYIKQHRFPLNKKGGGWKFTPGSAHCSLLCELFSTNTMHVRSFWVAILTCCWTLRVCTWWKLPKSSRETQSTPTSPLVKGFSFLMASPSQDLEVAKHLYSQSS